MAADLHIHAMIGVEESDLAIFFESAIGSKWFIGFLGKRTPWDSPERIKAWEAISKSPNTHICEVSWLKAALTEDNDTFVPSIAEQVTGLIGEDLPVLDDDLYIKLLSTLEVNNSTPYAVSSSNEIVRFLDKHKGERLFTVSW